LFVWISGGGSLDLNCREIPLQELGFDYSF
jgi:hypothetical protein